MPFPYFLFKLWDMDIIMKKKPPLIKIIVCVFPFIALSMVYVLKEIIYKLSTYFPACPIYSFFHVYCPGCGNTRSVQHLLLGDIIGSLKFNITPLFCLIIGGLAYIELVFYIFGKNIRIIPRGKVFWTPIIILFLLYLILRNIFTVF